VSVPGNSDGGQVDHQLDNRTDCLARHPIGDRPAALAAAGIVVTEIKTPTKAPDLAEVSPSMPTIPAMKPTIHESASGFQMKLVNGRSAISIDSWKSPRAVKIHFKITVAAIPTTKPKTRVPNGVAECRRRSRCRYTMQRAGQTPVR
jgi:hypothetical protein